MTMKAQLPPRPALRRDRSNVSGDRPQQLPGASTPAPRESVRRRVGALLGALREAHFIEGDLLAQVIEAISTPTRPTIEAEVQRIEAKEAPELPRGSTDGMHD